MLTPCWRTQRTNAVRSPEPALALALALPLAAGMPGPGALLQAAASTIPQIRRGIANIRRMTVVLRPGR
jgi:hypothetical protein